ncbi:hypothetical protein MPTK1_5g03180 [Marchantia polymorpha subsp. ruderalis]|nr:hypothetical protein MARPO_0124s0005 [Marchantia polymorpha]BBN10389.1 hypothetical protein Mp_5g03180 [Marchantia polymorpha subsp. ruderalis]|eukprot:PTQ30428.1 hypothetical protein MARPO_0124s0005 [Marchantia polymorpha]
MANAVSNTDSGSAAARKNHNTITPASAAAAAASPPHPLSKSSSSMVDGVKEPAEYFAKYRIYERDYLRRINHKYFSGKKFAGSGRVFETITSVDGFTVKESSEPPLKRFLEIPSSLEEHSQSGAPPSAKKPSRRKP